MGLAVPQHAKSPQAKLSREESCLVRVGVRGRGRGRVRVRVRVGIRGRGRGRG